MPVDHFPLIVSPEQFEPVVSFLKASLEHIGFKEFRRPHPGVVGLGDDVGSSYLWIAGLPDDEIDDKILNLILKKTHIAFSARTYKEVDEFYARAMKAGGTDNGPPGLRPHFHPTHYYAAFVRDPACQINWEVVCRTGKES